MGVGAGAGAGAGAGGAGRKRLCLAETRPRTSRPLLGSTSLMRVRSGSCWRWGGKQKQRRWWFGTWYYRADSQKSEEELRADIDQPELEHSSFKEVEEWINESRK